MSTENCLELINVSKSFVYYADRPRGIKEVLIRWLKGRFTSGEVKRIDVLKDISFSIKHGEFVGLMGRNGAGKSTILKIISGIYQPTSGTVKVHGRIAPLLELGAGFADELSGYENVFLNASILGFSKIETDLKIKEIVDFSELGDRIHMPVRNYSSGMLMRLGFSIASHLDAPILLFDEVLAVGDSGFQKKCLNKIMSLHGQGRAIVLVTHSPDQVKMFCNRCIVFEASHKVFDGDVEQGTQVYLNNFN